MSASSARCDISPSTSRPSRESSERWLRQYLIAARSACTVDRRPAIRRRWPVRRPDCARSAEAIVAAARPADQRARFLADVARWRRACRPARTCSTSAPTATASRSDSPPACWQRQVQPAAPDTHAGGHPPAARVRARCVLPHRRCRLRASTCRCCSIDDPVAAAAGAAQTTRWVSVPQIDAAQLAAYVFTSGSTGAPVPHRKTWGRLVQCVRAEAARLPGERPRRLRDPRHRAATAHVRLRIHRAAAAAKRRALCAERPFFPADIAAALAAVPRPRMLISTPVHLRALLAADTALPALD